MKMNELRQNSRSVNISHLINGKVSRFVNLYLLNFDSGAESGVVFQPRATPWVSGSSDGCALQGRRNPPPSQGRRCAPTHPGALPRAGMLRAVAASPRQVLKWRNLLYGNIIGGCSDLNNRVINTLGFHKWQA